MSDKAKVSKMTPKALIEEHQTGVSGLRQRQVVPELQRHAKCGDREVIDYLNHCGLQSAAAA
jgi:hypothetical protein